MRSSLQMVTGLAVAGIVATGGSALTSTGVTTTNQAASAQFVGGTVSQAVTGATLDSIDYSFTNGTKTVVRSVLLTFANELTDGKTVSILPSGGAYAGAATTFTCPAVAVGAGANTSTCTADGVDATADGYLGITSLAITVS
jgi:hypothetical protein